MHKSNFTGQKMAYSIEEVAALLGVSRGHLRNENARGKLRFTRSGRRVLISRTELDRYLNTQPSDSTAN
jgi:excisionase family DNA binding protein